MISNHLQFHDKELNGLHTIWRGERVESSIITGKVCPRWKLDRGLKRGKKVDSLQKVSNSFKNVCELDNINEDITLPNPTDVSLKENRQRDLGPLR